MKSTRNNHEGIKEKKRQTIEKLDYCLCIRRYTVQYIHLLYTCTKNFFHCTFATHKEHRVYRACIYYACTSLFSPFNRQNIFNIKMLLQKMPLKKKSKDLIYSAKRRHFIGVPYIKERDERKKKKNVGTSNTSSSTLWSWSRPYLLSNRMEY